MKTQGTRSEKVREIALFNLRSLPQPIKEDVVAGNRYFLRARDGFDANRILDHSLLDRMDKQITGQLAVAVPHQAY